MLVADNVDRIIHGYDVIIDGTDTFETRYLLNDAAVAKNIPVIHASVFRFEGQLTTFIPYEGPCYRCLYPTPPPPELAPGCSVAGVLGVVPGIMGMLQANEALKVLLGIGDTLAGRLLLFDALDTTFTELKLRRDPSCPVCSTEAVAARAEPARPLPIPQFGLAGRGERAVRPRRADRMSTVWIPQVLRAQAGGKKQLELAGGYRRRGRRRRSSTQYPSLRGQLLTDGRRHQPLRQRLRQRPGRPLSRRAHDAGRGARRGAAAAGDGGRGRLTMAPSGRASSAGSPPQPPSRSTRTTFTSTPTRRSLRTAAGTTTSSTRSATRRSSRSPGCRRTRPSGSSRSSRRRTRPARSRTASRSTSSRTSRRAACSKADSIILEPTSGNTGIALAMIGRRKGYRVALVMPDNVTNERRQMAALFGAEVIDSPGASRVATARSRWRSTSSARDERFVMPYQYGNEANPRAH